MELAKNLELRDRATAASVGQSVLLFLTAVGAPRLLSGPTSFSDLIFICLLANGLRLLLRIFEKTAVFPILSKRWRFSYVIMTLLTGLCWGLIGRTAIQKAGLNDVETATVLILISGVGSAACVSLSSVPTLAKGFIGTLLFPEFLQLATLPQGPCWILMAVFSIYFVFLCFSIDFQERVTRQLEERELQYRTLADAVAEGVIIHDGKNVIDVNQALRDLFGYGDMAVGKLDLGLACAPEEVDRVKSFIASGSLLPYTAKFQRLDKTLFLAEVRVKNIKFKGVPARVVCIRDITAERAADESLRQHEEKMRAVVLAREKAAVESSRMKSEFLANMSHEIRTPLNGIIGTTELLTELPMSPLQRKYISTLRTSGNSLFAIVNDILDFSKIEAGKLALESKPFNPISMIDAQIDLMRPKADGKKLGIQIHIDPRISSTLLGDSGRVGQILLNLISNAVKFTNEGAVVVRADLLDETPKSARLKFTVIDEGIGIDAETLSTLFTPFTQADASTSRKFGGTGLGLSISKKLVEMMRGDIGAKSEIGKGSEFWFVVDFEKIESLLQSDSDYAAITDTTERDQVRRERILIAEDNKTNQMLAMANVEKLGYEVSVVESGKAVLDVLSRESFDLILMDCQMPEMDGFTATQMIRDLEISTGRHIPIIALTANAMKEDEMRCLNAGMDDYITKPFRRKVLSDVLEKWLGKFAA